MIECSYDQCPLSTNLDYIHSITVYWGMKLKLLALIKKMNKRLFYTFILNTDKWRKAFWGLNYLDHYFNFTLLLTCEESSVAMNK